MNINEAFTFPFRDKEWGTKFLFGAFFSLLSVFFVGIPVLYGYYIELLQRVRQNEPNPLPEWKDPGIKFITGLKYLVGLLLYYAPLLVIIIPVFFIFLLSIFFGQTAEDLLSDGLVFVSIIGIIVPYSLFVTLLMPIITIQFASHESIREELQIHQVISIFKERWQDVLLIAVLSFALSILASVGILFFLVGILFTSFYAELIIFHMYGQIARSIITSGKQ